MFTDTGGTTPVASDGDAIAHWADQSGTGNHVTQSTVANRPLYRPAGTAGLDVEATAQGDSTDFLDGGTSLALATQTGFTILVVLEQTGTSSPSAFSIVGRDASGNRGWGTSISPSSGRAQFAVATSSSAVTLRTGSKIDCRALPCLLTFRFNGSTGELSIRVNGADDDGTLSGSVPSTVIRDGSSLRVGSSGFNNPFDGHIAQVALYDVALSDTDRNNVEDYLMAEYRLMGFEENTGLVSPDLDLHEGVTGDGTYWYAVNDNAAWLRKYDASWSQVAENASPKGGTSYTQAGAPTYYNGSIYLIVDGTPGVGVLVFSASDLSRTAIVDLSSDFAGNGPGQLAIDPATGIAYAIPYETAGSTDLLVFRVSDWTLLDTVTLSASIIESEGAAVRAGVLYTVTGSVSVGSRGRHILYRIDPATGLVRTCYHDGRAATTTTPEAEGFTFVEGNRIRMGMLESASVQDVIALDVVYPAATPTPGVASLTATTPTSASLSATAATNPAHGSSFSYQWQRSDDSGDTWSDLSGQTSLTLTDTGLTTGSTYLYRLEATDGDSPPNIVITNTITVSLVMKAGYYYRMLASGAA